jgi:hypothetical protein
VKTKDLETPGPGEHSGDGVSKALRRLARIAAYSAPIVMTFGAQAMAQPMPPPPRHAIPALSVIGAAAFGVGLATAGAYKLLRSRLKKRQGKPTDGSAPEE